MAKQFIYSPLYVQLAFRNSNGYPMGQLTTPDSPTPGTAGIVYAPYLMKNIVSFEGFSPTRAVAVDLGGSKIRAQADVGVESFGSGTLTLSERDDVFESFITASSVDSSTVSGWRDSGSNVNNIIAPAFFLIITTKADVIDESTTPPTITKQYVHFIFPNCQITKANSGSAAQGGGTNPNPLAYTILPSPAYRALNGLPFSSTTMALADNSDVSYVSQTPQPIMVATYVEGSSPDGAFIMPYRPLSTQADTTDKKLTLEGVAVSFTTVNATTGAVTATAGTANQIFVAIAETAYQAI